MIHLARRLARADLTRSPGRTFAVAALLAAACWLPAVLDTDPATGTLLSFATAFSATVGAIAADERRPRLLALNGARPVALSLVASASMVVPGVLALAASAAVMVLGADGVGAAHLLLTTVLVPVAAAPLAVWVVRRSSASPDEPGPRMGFFGRLSRSLALSALVFACILMPLLGLALVALRLTTGAWATTRLRRIAGGVLALAVVAASAVFAGSSATWSDLSLILLVTVPALAVAVVVVGMHAVSLGAGLASRCGPRARLALAPLTGRRRALAPVVGLVSLVTALGVTESVVGASFGEREANRERDLPTISEPAGNRPDQAIASVAPVDPAALRAVAAEETAGTGATAVVIEQLGVGNANVTFSILGVLTGSLVPPTGVDRRLDLSVDHPVGTRRMDWIGIVAPGDLDELGWGSAAGGLAAGQLVLVGGAAPSGGVTDLLVMGESVTLPSSVIAGSSGGVLLPGALVSSDTAAALTAVRTTSVVVVVPSPGAAAPPTADRLVAIATSIERRARELVTVVPTGMTPAEQAAFETLRSSVEFDAALGADNRVSAGSDEVVLYESGPLNDVPGFARTADEGRGRLLGLAALPVLMTVAGVLLALGATRPDDLVLEAQGAPDGLRSLVSAIQAGVVAGSASVFAALMGVGVPALAFSVYDGGDLPDIPLVVPAVVWVVLVAVPLVAVALSAVLPLVHRRSGPDHLASLGGAGV